MRKTTFLLLVGFFVFLAPFMGVPQVYRDWTLFVLGGSAMFVALLFRLDERRRERKNEYLYHEEYDPSAESDTDDTSVYAPTTEAR